MTAGKGATRFAVGVEARRQPVVWERSAAGG